MGYTQNCEICQGTSLGTLIIIQKKQFEGQCEDHVFAIKVPYFDHRKRGLLDTQKIVKFRMDPPWARLLLFRKSHFVGPSEDRLLAIKGPYLGHF